jgi:hypothetical protein
MQINPLQHYIEMIDQWLVKARTETLWDQLPALYPAAQAIAQLAEDIVVWLDFKGYDGDAHYFLENIGQCHESILRIYMWAEQYPEYLPKDNPSCRDARDAVLQYAHMDTVRAKWLNDKLPQEVWDGFDSH